MNILLVYAHPEPQSLNGALRDFAVSHLQQVGQQVQVSDLYAMNWKATLDSRDFPARQPGRFDASLDSAVAFKDDTQNADIKAEQQKLLWADTVIFQFPLWWFSMPAIMKGWFDRVYAHGFAYGVGEFSDSRWGDRYGEGVMTGKRAMLLVTTGGWDSHYSSRGINGPIDDLLFPIQHGCLFYPGFSVLPPLVLYRVQKMQPSAFTEACQQLAQRLDTLATTTPIPFRRQNFGDYQIPAMTLRDDILPEQGGFAVHVQES
ncbi:NAD(P)H-dependent oxidoreductase [Shewanella sp.]|jgi:NAD(P)H dehydrogenase (quinone)|uniref:NAD(P)H-dependent oxidoreductase n=1 Tax=Shewanella sp. TaxID=50422 RepID=UPI003D0F49D6